jgi:phosphate transport system substrate-binding protein
MKQKSVVYLAVIILFAITTSAVFAAAISVKGSTTVLPIAQKVAEAFMKENPDIRISISGGGSGNGIKWLIDGTCDIADSSRFIKKKEVELAIGRGVYPVPFCIAYDCIVPIVHSGSHLDNISIEQLKAIYRGRIKNWKQLGGPNKKIVVVSRDTSSGTYEVWQDKVMQKNRVYPGALLQASNGAIVQTVAKNKYAIGYIGLGYLNDSVKALSVNGVVGSAETTLDNTFPISRPLFMFTPGWPNEESSRFINFILNPAKGQKLVKEAGFVPLY